MKNSFIHKSLRNTKRRRGRRPTARARGDRRTEVNRAPGRLPPELPTAGRAAIGCTLVVHVLSFKKMPTFF